jgi:hypothetical protein
MRAAAVGQLRRRDVLAGDGQLGGWVRRAKAQRPVRAVLVVVLEAVLRWDKAWHAEAVTSVLD